jgi:hypothetical protein
MTRAIGSTKTSKTTSKTSTKARRRGRRTKTTLSTPQKNFLKQSTTNRLYTSNLSMLPHNKLIVDNLKKEIREEHLNTQLLSIDLHEAFVIKKKQARTSRTLRFLHHQHRRLSTEESTITESIISGLQLT